MDRGVGTAGAPLRAHRAEEHTSPGANPCSALCLTPASLCQKHLPASDGRKEGNTLGRWETQTESEADAGPRRGLRWEKSQGTLVWTEGPQAW